MNQVQHINKQQENNSLQDNIQNRFSVCEEVVDTLVENGLPSSFSPEHFIKRLSDKYGITYQEARTCLKLAVKQLEAESLISEEDSQDERYAQSGYFYPQSYASKQATTKPKDGMDSLSSLGSYNRLMFGLR